MTFADEFFHSDACSCRPSDGGNNRTASSVFGIRGLLVIRYRGRVVRVLFQFDVYVSSGGSVCGSLHKDRQSFYSAHDHAEVAFMAIGVCFYSGAFWLVMPLLGLGSYALVPSNIVCGLDWKYPSNANKTYVGCVFHILFLYTGWNNVLLKLPSSGDFRSEWPPGNTIHDRNRGYATVGEFVFYYFFRAVCFLRYVTLLYVVSSMVFCICFGRFSL